MARRRARRNAKLYGSLPPRGRVEAALRNEGFHTFTFVGSANHPVNGPVWLYTAVLADRGGDKYYRINVGRFHRSDRLDVRTERVAKLNPRRRKARRNTSVAGLLSRVDPEVVQIAKKLRGGDSGVRTNLVGGAVVDLLQGRIPKDWDIEVFGMSFEDLAQRAKQIGRADTVGSFGVVKLAMPSGLDLDLSVPRRDNKAGVGPKGFDPRMTNREAARRRDFTINSMALDLKTGTFIDPFHGLKDLHAGVLRATDPKLFVEDPLRALRAMQLLARKAKTVDPGTIRLIKGMKGSFKDLPPERVLEEWRKLLLKAPKPSVGLEFLKESEWIEHFPELMALEGTPQHPDWHSEGNVWIHTKQIADAAAQTRHRVPENQREAFVFGAMLHDVGKPMTTITPEDVAAGRAPKERLYTARGHDSKGRVPARAFMERIGASKKTTALAEELVGLHMQPYTMLSGKAGRAAYARLARKIRKAGGDFNTLAVLSQCDACATGQGRHFHHGEPDWEHATSENLYRWAEVVDGPEAAAPLVQGRDLIALGHKPGQTFGVILGFAQDLQDTGADRDEILTAIQKEYPLAKKNSRRKARRNPKGFQIVIQTPTGPIMDDVLPVSSLEDALREVEENTRLKLSAKAVRTTTRPTTYIYTTQQPGIVVILSPV
jgi:tRNA nucleotidyltransferase (CCA-adding enzyme)